MGQFATAGVFYFCGGLRRAVLGGAARAVGNCRGGAGNDSGFHGAVRDYLSANATPDASTWGGARHRAAWGRGIDEPVIFVWRSAGGSRWGDRAADRRR